MYLIFNFEFLANVGDTRSVIVCCISIFTFQLTASILVPIREF